MRKTTKFTVGCTLTADGYSCVAFSDGPAADRKGLMKKKISKEKIAFCALSDSPSLHSFFVVVVVVSGEKLFQSLKQSLIPV